MILAENSCRTFSLIKYIQVKQRKKANHQDLIYICYPQPGIHLTSIMKKFALLHSHSDSHIQLLPSRFQGLTLQQYMALTPQSIGSQEGSLFQSLIPPGAVHKQLEDIEEKSEISQRKSQRSAKQLQKYKQPQRKFQAVQPVFKKFRIKRQKNTNLRNLHLISSLYGVNFRSLLPKRFQLTNLSFKHEGAGKKVQAKQGERLNILKVQNSIVKSLSNKLKQSKRKNKLF